MSHTPAPEEVVHSVPIKVEPRELRSSSEAGSDRSAGNIVSVSAGRRTLLMLYLTAPCTAFANPAVASRSRTGPSRHEVTFEDHNGSVSCHQWLPAGSLLVGFSSGTPSPVTEVQHCVCGHVPASCRLERRRHGHADGCRSARHPHQVTVLRTHRWWARGEHSNQCPHTACRGGSRRSHRHAESPQHHRQVP